MYFYRGLIVLARTLCLVFSLFWYLLVFSFGVQAQSLTQSPLTIAVNKTSYPYHYLTKDGQADGVTVDLWKLWAEKQGVEVEFKILTWQETLDQVLSGQIDIHAGLAKTLERESKFAFTKAFFYQDSHVFVHREFTNVNSLEKIRPLTLGIVAGSSHVDVITRLYPDIQLKRYKSRFALYDGALRGEIAAFTNLERISNNYPRYKELQQLFPAYKRLLFKKSAYAASTLR